MIPEVFDKSWPRVNPNKFIRIDALFSLCNDTQNYHRGHPPLVLLVDGALMIAGKIYWKRGHQVLQHLQKYKKYKIPDLDSATVREWLEACMASVVSLSETGESMDTSSIDHVENKLQQHVEELAELDVLQVKDYEYSM